MVNKELDLEACRVFVCPNINLVDEKCRENNISPEIIENIKGMLHEYLKATYHYPRYRDVKMLFPAVLYIVTNMKIMNGKKTVDTRGNTSYGYTLDFCCSVFGFSTSTTTRKWVRDILKELKIDHYTRNYNVFRYSDIE